MPEPELPFLVEPPIHSKLPTLRYLVRVRVVETQDWTSPPSSSDDNSPEDTDDRNDPDWLDRGNRGRSGPWPRRHRFGGVGGDGAGHDSGEALDPQLGPGWGPTFKQASHVIVGEIPCPLLPVAGPRSSGPRLLRRTQCQLLTSGLAGVVFRPGA